MIVLSNTVEQTVAPGQPITFDTVVLHTGNGECHRANTGSVKMRRQGYYIVSFKANVSGTAPVSLVVETGGEPLPETIMVTTPAAVTDLMNVSCETVVGNCCCDYDRITVVNTSAADITVGANPTLFVRRVA